MSEGRITPVILSGGSGTRLWPLSREEKPKQLLALTGDATMLQTTVARVADADLFAPPVVIASARHAALIEAQLDEAGAAPSRLILEPCARNTAAAIALAAFDVAPDELLLVMPSDHVIARPDAFVEAVRTAAPTAAQGWLVTFGIRPSRAETGYGYIRRGAELGEGVFRADQFVEKPDAATASRYVESGDYDWNGGIFLFRADALLEELRRHAPEIFDAAEAASRGARRDGSQIHPDETAFAASPSRSIDHAVMEHGERVAVVPVDMAWSDVGSWDALHEIGSADAAGNVADGDAIVLDSQGCLIRSDGPVVAAVGVSDLIIVATAEAVLVMPRGESQRVREVVEAAKTKAQSSRS